MFTRTASDRDLDAVRALLVETWHATYDAIYGRDRVIAITDDWHSIEALRARLKQPHSEFVVADDGAAIGGMAFASVVEVPADRLVASLGPSLVVTALTRDRALVDALVRSPDVDRLNVGPIPTSHVEWDQPHEGNLFELLYERRAIQRADSW